jgi:hypothetical protein
MTTLVCRGMVALAAASAMACSATNTHVQRLRELPVALVSDDGYTAWDGAQVLIGRFEDLRTPEYGRAFASASIPFVSLVHSGGQVEYPEHAGLLDGKDGRRPLRRIGGLETELPFLLARALPGKGAMADDDPRARREGAGAWDYVVGGRVLQSTVTQHSSVALGAVALLGVPVVFSRHELRLEVTIAPAAAKGDPFFQQVYRFDERMAEGLYYHHGSARKLGERAVKQTVERIAKDVMVAVADHRGRVAMGRGAG